MTDCWYALLYAVPIGINLPSPGSSSSSSRMSGSIDDVSKKQRDDVNQAIVGDIVKVKRGSNELSQSDVKATCCC